MVPSLFLLIISAGMPDSQGGGEGFSSYVLQTKSSVIQKQYVVFSPQKCIKNCAFSSALWPWKYQRKWIAENLIYMKDYHSGREIKGNYNLRMGLIFGARFFIIEYKLSSTSHGHWVGSNLKITRKKTLMFHKMSQTILIW